MQYSLLVNKNVGTCITATKKWSIHMRMNWFCLLLMARQNALTRQPKRSNSKTSDYGLVKLHGTGGNKMQLSVVKRVVNVVLRQLCLGMNIWIIRLLMQYQISSWRNWNVTLQKWPWTNPLRVTTPSSPPKLFWCSLPGQHTACASLEMISKTTGQKEHQAYMGLGYVPCSLYFVSPALFHQYLSVQ